MNTIDLEGRVAVITGGAGDIGLAIAERFLASGATVELWDLDGARLDEAASRHPADRLTTARLSVIDEPAVKAAADALVARRGRIDILVNGAGIAGKVAPTWDYDSAEWWRIIEINLRSTFLCARHVLPAMRAADYGRIINIASIAGKEGNANDGAYSASKAGVIALTKSMGKELATSGIRVNCVTPAVFDTRILAQQTPEHIAVVRGKVPMGRFGAPPELAAMIAWLASEDCSFSTGAVFDISGGRATY